MSLYSFCANVTVKNATENVTDVALQADLVQIRNFFGIVQAIICAIGICGNVLNLITLCSPSLQTVPFMYIRAFAVFDLIALIFIAGHFVFEFTPPHPFYIVFYKTHMEVPLINTFLIGSLYCALILTLERYVLIRHPHHRRGSPRRTARALIGLVLLLALVLHVPMGLMFRVAVDKTGRFAPINNRELLCEAPWYSIFNYYRFFRECLRMVCVVVMTVLNVIIAHQLQLTKEKRKKLVIRHPPPPSTNLSKKESNASSALLSRREMNHLMRSFTERKLTALMFAICFIYIIGNIPQMVVMLFQSETTDRILGFQIYRNVANSLEVLNHCLNFFVFCMASSDYTRAFLLNCLCMRRVLVKIPLCARFIYSRRASSYFLASQATSLVQMPAETEVEEEDSRTLCTRSPSWICSRRCSAAAGSAAAAQTAAVPAMVIGNTAAIVKACIIECDENGGDVFL